jgi:cytochrome c553
MTTKEELRQIVDALSDEDASELLEYAHWLQQEAETLSDAEIARVQHGEEQIRRGETVSWDELRRELNV